MQLNLKFRYTDIGLNDLGSKDGGKNDLVSKDDKRTYLYIFDYIKTIWGPSAAATILNRAPQLGQVNSAFVPVRPFVHWLYGILVTLCRRFKISQRLPLKFKQYDTSCSLLGLVVWGTQEPNLSGNSRIRSSFIRS